jgi:uncharacterized protein
MLPARPGTTEKFEFQLCRVEICFHDGLLKIYSVQDGCSVCSGYHSTVLPPWGKPLNPLILLKKYFAGNEKGFDLVYEHSRHVASKALMVAIAQGLDGNILKFIEEAALLHDIGVVGTGSPRLGCRGTASYLCHGILGREILDREGYPEHGLVCERHIGVGLTTEDIIGQALPLPHREMTPVTVAERIICFADLFYTKKPDRVDRELTVEEVRRGLSRFGEKKIIIFEAWLREFLPASGG